MHVTMSLCPVCGADTPATITEEDKVYIDTHCVMHGSHRGVLEPNPNFYRHIRANWSPTIYDGVLVDVTRRCNARCSYCFQALGFGKDPSVEDLVQRVKSVPPGYPLVLSGGEPTIRPDLHELVEEFSRAHPVVILTNGFRVNPNLKADWVLSYHDGTKDLFYNNLARGYTFWSIIYTATTSEELLHFGQEIVRLRDQADNFRIHSAAPVGAFHNGRPTRLYLSDMVAHLSRQHEVELVGPGKTVFYPVRMDGIDVKLVSWASKFDIDLIDLACPPYYLSERGMEHLVTTLVKREFQCPS